MPRLPESLGPWDVSIWGMFPLRASPAKVGPGVMRGESTPEPRHGDLGFRGSRGWGGCAYPIWVIVDDGGRYIWNEGGVIEKHSFIKFLI